MEPETVCYTRVFAAGDLRGNTATVVLLARTPTPRQMRALCFAQTPCKAKTEGDARGTACLAWPEQDAIAVRCFYHGRMIEFCGHGLLAVANLWWLRTGLCPSLRSRTERFSTRLDNGSIWLSVARRYCRRSRLPASCGDWFESDGQPGPCGSAVAGGKRGYRIVEWPVDTDLRTLKPRFEHMIRDETRSIIATQPFSTTGRSGRPAWDFSLRYFAPAYGVLEDNATGSANAVLADYWSGRGLCGREGTDAIFRAWQCSKDGGAVMSRVNGSFVEIGGPFHVIETTAAGFEPADFSTAVRA